MHVLWGVVGERFFLMKFYHNKLATDRLNCRAAFPPVSRKVRSTNQASRSIRPYICMIIRWLLGWYTGVKVCRCHSGTVALVLRSLYRFTMYPSFLEFAQSLISVRMFGLDKFASMINLDSIYCSILLLYLQNQWAGEHACPHGAVYLEMMLWFIN
jgi:hypothetical protein